MNQKPISHGEMKKKYKQVIERNKTALMKRLVSRPQFSNLNTR